MGYSNIDAKESWWADRCPSLYLKSREEVYRMRRSPFSSQRLDSNLSEKMPAPPKRSKGLSFEEMEADRWNDVPMLLGGDAA